MRILLVLALSIVLAGAFLYVLDNLGLWQRRRACSFCRKTIDDVRILIAARRVMICDECVDACGDVIVHQAADATRPREREEAGRPGRVVRFAPRST
jgi:hypothetical protein